MAGIGFGPLLSAIGAGLGQGMQDLQKQRAQQQQLQLQQQNAQRQQMMLQAYLQKQQQAGDLAALSAPSDLSSLGGGGAGVGAPTSPGGMPGSPYVGSGSDPASNMQTGGALASGKGRMSYDQLYPLVAARFGNPGAADTMTRTMLAESGGNPYAVGDNGQSFGLSQINEPAHGKIAESAYGNPRAAIDLAYDISKGGTDFSPWTMYKNRQYLKYGPSGGDGIQTGLSAGASNAAAPRYFPTPDQSDNAISQEQGAPVSDFSDKALGATPAAQVGTQVAQASPQQAGGSTTDAGPQMAMPAPPNYSQIYREKQALAASRGINNPAAIAAAATQEFTRQRQAFTENMAIYGSTRADRRENQSLQQGAVRLDLEKRRLADEETKAKQAGVSEPFNAQVTADGKTEARMVFTKKDTPGFWDADTGERVKGKVTKTTGSMNAPIDDDTAKMLAEARLKGDQSVMQGLGYGNQGAANREKVYAAMRAQGATGAEIAAARAEYSAAIAGAQTAGRRGAQIGMAINELQGFIPEAKRISGQLDRSQFPTLNSVLLSAQAGTGNEDVKRLALVTNEVINAYASVAVRTGQTTDAARAQGAAILDKAFTQGQYAAVLDEMMNLAQTAKGASAATIKEIVDRLAGNNVGAPPAPGGGQGASPQQGAPQGAPSPGIHYQWDGEKLVPTQQ